MVIVGIVFNWTDVAAAVVLILCLLRGLKRGLSGELAWVVSAAVAVFLGYRFYRPLGERFMAAGGLDEQQAHALAFLAMLGGALVLLFLLRLLVRQLMEFTFKGAIERVGGALAGLLRGVLFVAVFLLVCTLCPKGAFRDYVIDASFVGRHFAAPVLRSYDELTRHVSVLPPLQDDRQDPETSDAGAYEEADDVRPNR